MAVKNFNDLSQEQHRRTYAKKEIEKLGFEITNYTERMIEFFFNGHKVTIFPFTGWHTGKSIKDGRGIKNLLKQIKPK